MFIRFSTLWIWYWRDFVVDWISRLKDEGIDEYIILPKEFIGNGILRRIDRVAVTSFWKHIYLGYSDKS